MLLTGTKDYREGRRVLLTLSSWGLAIFLMKRSPCVGACTEGGSQTSSKQEELRSLCMLISRVGGFQEGIQSHRGMCTARCSQSQAPDLR